jgi:thiamine pyrophosphokinase
MHMARIVIFANGELPNAAAALSLLQPSDSIVCADGGTRQALALGLKPQVIVGDLDSLAPAEHEGAVALGALIQQHPHDKNETDLELAIRYAVSRSPSSILIVAGLGRRLDQTIGNIALLAASDLATLDVRMDDGLEEVFFCRQEAEVRGQPGDIVSLIPWGSAVQGVSTQRLRWPLHEETLYPDQTRGISNEMLEPTAHVSISAGLLLVIHRRQSQSRST